MSFVSDILENGVTFVILCKMVREKGEPNNLSVFQSDDTALYRFIIKDNHHPFFRVGVQTGDHFCHFIRRDRVDRFE